LMEERISKGDALETPLDPQKYIVGPGDIFSFNVWGPAEAQIPVTVSPEGKMSIPSVGEINVGGKTLVETQTLIRQNANTVYQNSTVTLTLEALRIFRIHVVGEVKYPGTYLAQAIQRIPELISDAGGVTDRARVRDIEIRHRNGIVEPFDLSVFEQKGEFETGGFVDGGDVIYVPPICLDSSLVSVESDFQAGGWYQVAPRERLLEFLQRIRALSQNTDLQRITVVRFNPSKKTNEIFAPFSGANSGDSLFELNGNDRILLPSRFVYVKGAVRSPGAYPYVMHLTARDYAGMAGGDYQSGSLQGVKVVHARTGKTKKGLDIVIEPGDVVEVPQSWGMHLREIGPVISAVATLVMSVYYIQSLANRN
jgi:protein involved in polysaccharide export with SLBB domain